MENARVRSQPCKEGITDSCSRDTPCFVKETQPLGLEDSRLFYLYGCYPGERPLVTLPGSALYWQNQGPIFTFGLLFWYWNVSVTLLATCKQHCVLLVPMDQVYQGVSSLVNVVVPGSRFIIFVQRRKLSTGGFTAVTPFGRTSAKKRGTLLCVIFSRPAYVTTRGCDPPEPRAWRVLPPHQRWRLSFLRLPLTGKAA